MPAVFSGLPEEHFARAFPFHVAFDECLTVVSAGHALRKVCPGLDAGSPLGDHFTLERPPIATSFAAIREQQHSLFVLKARSGPLRLRGQMVEIAADGVIVFLCSPWVTDLDEVAALGLSIGDFARHNPIADFLFLLQSKNSALDEARELTERLRRQRGELEATRGRLQGVLDTAADGIITIDERGIVQSFNAAAARIFGYAPEEVVGRNVSMLMPSPDRERHDGYVARYLRPGEARIIGSGREVEGLRRDGTRFPLYLAISDVAVGGQRIFTGILKELTEEKRAERALRDSEQRLRMVIDTALDAVVTIDAAGLLTDWNAQATQMFGWTREEAVGRPVAETLIPERDRARQRRALTRFLETGESSILNRRVELVALRRSGEEFPVELSVAPVWLADGVAFNAFVRDITDRRRQEDELRQAKDLAEAANRAKSQFLATMSHEIRTPMNGVLGMARLLLDSGLGPSQRNYAEKLQHSGEILLRVINDILDFSRIEAGRLELQARSFDLRAVVASAVALFADAAARKGVVLETDLGADLPSTVRGDPDRLEQVLMNLLSNAFKFTDAGRVSVAARLLERRADSDLLCFDVVDSGPGIDPGEQERLFEPFVQSDATAARRHGGSGLGLAICRQIVERWGGDIGVDSRPGEGSRFWFTVPLGRMAEPALAVPADRLRGLRVLVLAADGGERGILEGYLRSWSMEALGAVSVAGAVETLEEARGRGEPVDVVVVGGLDGGSAMLRSITAAAAEARPPLVALGTVGLEDQTLVAAALARPTSKSDLLDCLTRLFCETPGKGTAGKGTVPGTEGTGKGTVPGMRVLVAEDNEINREVVTIMLEQLGHRVESVTNGLAALEALDRGVYDIVLMDCQMPELDGYAATRRIRERPGAERRIAVIGVTANAMKGDREECLAAGMDDYIPKPIDFDELAAVLQRWSRERGQSP